MATSKCLSDNVSPHVVPRVAEISQRIRLKSIKSTRTKAMERHAENKSGRKIPVRRHERQNKFGNCR